MMVDNCLPVITLTSFRGIPQILVYKTMMLPSVKPPPKTINKVIVLVTDEELD
jgi:hypothetical protein